MKYKYYWYYCKTNGMIGKYRHNPDETKWIGAFDTIRDLKAATAHLSIDDCTNKNQDKKDYCNGNGQ